MKIENSLGRGMKSFLLKFQKLNFPHTRFFIIILKAKKNFWLYICDDNEECSW